MFEQRVDEGEEKRRARSLPFLEITITATGTETNDRAAINKEPSLHCVNNNYPGPAEEGTLYKWDGCSLNVLWVQTLLFVHWKHCQRHNGPRVLSLNLNYLFNYIEFVLILAGEVTQVFTLYPGSVVPLAMFFAGVPWLTSFTGPTSFARIENNLKPQPQTTSLYSHRSMCSLDWFLSPSFHYLASQEHQLMFPHHLLWLRRSQHFISTPPCTYSILCTHFTNHSLD